MEYEWDNAKAVLNLLKHGVDFTDAIAALEDPNRLEDFDIGIAHGEARTKVLGMSYGKVLFVVTTSRGEMTTRIITARKATRYEQDRYYTGDRETW